MKPMHSTLFPVAALLAGLLLAPPVLAHDAWVEARDGGYVVLYGHGDKIESYAPTKVLSLTAADAAGNPLGVKYDATTAPVAAKVGGQPALLVLSFDNGYWTKTVDGSKNLPKNEVPGAISAGHSVKFGKTVLAWSAAVTRPQGTRLEIVPLGTSAPQAGKTLPVRVLWEGSPLAGAKIVRSEYGKEAPLVADAEGRADVPVAAGRQMIVVNYKIELANDPRADSYSAAANLVFEAR
jgi:nickel transport protein